MADIIDIRRADDPRDAIHRVVLQLADGELVGLPTETGYLVAGHALQEPAVRRLAAFSNESSVAFLALRSNQELQDYVPELSPLGRRMTRRCWPGPVLLESAVHPEQGLLRSLPEVTRQLLRSERGVRFHCSSDEILRAVLQLMPAPLVAVAGKTKSDGVVADAGQLAEVVGEGVSLIIDSGPARFDQPPTVVRIDGDRWDMVSEGVVSRTTVSRLASIMIVFVCTGNTCRSPMAEGLFRKILAERLKCRDDEVEEQGFLLFSAGLAATTGMPAAAESQEALRSAGVDLSGHSSQPLTSQMVRQADRIFTMTREHRQTILASHPEAADNVQVLSRTGDDISDPIGLGAAAYEACRSDIEQNIRLIVDELFPGG